MVRANPFVGFDRSSTGGTRFIDNTVYVETTSPLVLAETRYQCIPASLVHLAVHVAHTSAVYYRTTTVVKTVI